MTETERVKKVFEKKSIVNEKTGCIEFTGGKRKGYGVLRFRGKTDMAHRVSYMITKGHIPKGMFICHKCDNPACFNPKHLYLGTPKLNMEDKMSKGRFFNGHSAKTHCIHGHEYTKENTTLRKTESKGKKPWRACKICATKRREEFHAKNPNYNKEYAIQRIIKDLEK